MATSLPNPAEWLAAVLILLGMGAPCAFAAVESTGCTEPVHVKSDNIDADYRQNNVELRNVDISQCDVRVRAKTARAKGLNTENAHWNFDGDVRIDVESRGNLRANEAEVEFRDNQISKLNITGSPAEFEQKRKDDAMARGHAQEIEYDVTGGTVRLANDAWLTDGRIDLKCAQIFYDIRQQSAKCPAQPGSGQRVEFTIPPMKPKGESKKPEEDKKEAPKAP
ncbi:MAG TPA: LptA/OstA family protein [Steroidobacteraceae bacterium]|jgi:lipopolysaccharide transport protein LptA